MVLVDFDAEVAYLEALGKEDLQAWTERYLSTGDTGQISISSREDDLGEAVVDLFKGFCDETSKDRFRMVLVERVNSWSEAKDSLDYLSRAAILSTRIGAIDAYDCLWSYADTEQLKGRVDKNSMDVHQTLLRVIWGLVGIGNRLAQSDADMRDKSRHITESSRLLFERDKEDERYKLLCHDALLSKELTCA